MDKKCKKCGRELPLSEFNKDKSRSDGLDCRCRECRKQYYKQYYKDNIEHKKEYHKQWYHDNSERISEQNKEFYNTLKGYSYAIRRNNLKADREQGRISPDKDPLPPLEVYMKLLQQPDFYDGKEYHFTEMGLDRIDNSKPHTIDNVVPCTTEHNKQRGTMPFEEFKSKFQQQN